MPFIEANEVRLFYKDSGDGTPLVMLHGLRASHTAFNWEEDYFKQQYRVITMDARGHGQSDRPRGFTLNDHVEDVIAVLDHLKIRKAHILGVSMGSYIAQGVALEYPERVDKLILIATKSNGKTSSTQELMHVHADEIEGMDEPGKMDFLAKYIYYDTEAVARRMEEAPQPEMTELELAAAHKALAGFDFRSALPMVQAETLIISGKYDGLNPPDRGKELANLMLNGHFVEFEYSGHAPQTEEPERFRQVVSKFLEQ